MHRAALLLVAPVAACTTLSSAPSHQFLERSYFAPYTSSDTSISYEGVVAPHIFLLDKQRAAFSALAHNIPSTASGERAILTPMFVIRQLRDSSSAVRTPSFMPRLSLEYFRAHRLRDSLVGGTAVIAPHPEFSWARVDGVRLTIAHHSNGQAGCFLEGQKPGPSSFEADDCTPPPATGPLAINRANGDFSTSYVGLMAHTTFINRGGGERPLFTAGVAASYDWHVDAVLWGRLPAIERQFYGSWRARGQTDVMVATFPSCGSGSRGLCLLRGRARFSGMYERAPTRNGPLVSRLVDTIVPYRLYAEVSHPFDVLGSSGPFLRFVNGQDYYNIGFVRRRRAFLVGWMIDLSGYESVR